MTFGQITDAIILASAISIAITNLYKFFAKPTSKIKQRAEQQEKERIKKVVHEELSNKIQGFDTENETKHKTHQSVCAKQIKEEVLKEVEDDISRNSKTIEALVISARDVLREKIMGIYHKNKATHSMTEYEREALTQYYKDYKALDGNSYIDRRYERMNGWETIYDEDED